MLKSSEQESIRTVLSFMTSQNRKYAVYGTGKIGKLLINTARSEGLKKPEFFIEDNPKIKNFNGIKVLSPALAAKKNIEEIILATTCFQAQMKASLKRFGMAVRTVDIRPDAGGQAKAEHEKREKLNDYLYGQRLDETFFKKQAERLDAIRRLLAKGMSLDKTLAGFDGSRYSERVVEYAFAYQWLDKWGGNAKLLDIGCVLNNPVVAPELKKSCAEIWFCNLAPEPNQTGMPVFYHLASVENAMFLANTFDLVACLSTIEHIGFDNTQYGLGDASVYSKPNNKPLLNTIETIIKFLKPGGRFIASVPFGKRSVCRHRVTGKKAFQLFDYAALSAAISASEKIGAMISIKVYKGEKGGWKAVKRPENCRVPYAHGFPAAQAVAILEGEKLKQH